MSDPIPTEKLTREDAAAYLGVSVAFLATDAVTRRHRVPYVKVGRRCVYPRHLLDAWLAARTVNAPVVMTTNA